MSDGFVFDGFVLMGDSITQGFYYFTIQSRRTRRFKRRAHYRKK